MKKIALYAGSILVTLAMASCQKAETPVLGVEDPAQDETVVKEFGETVFTLSAGIDQTKTALDGVKVLWEVGDQIVVNGVTSKPLTQGGASADFEFDAVIDAPFNAVYPASAYVAGSYEAGETLVNLPKTQAYVEGSFDPAAALMVGVGEANGVSFSHAVAYLKLNFNKAVKSVRVMANNGMRVAGYHKISFDGLGTENYYTTTNYNTTTLKGEIASGADAIIAIPAKNYSTGLNIFVVTADDQYQILRTSALDVVSKKGHLLSKSALLDNLAAYQGPGIYCETDWNSFVCADESKYTTDETQKADASDFLGQDGEFNIYEDFTCTNLLRHGVNAAGLPGINNNIYFEGVLDGNNHTITQTATTVPMISLLKGTIKNLTLDGECKSVASKGWGNASFAIRAFGSALMDHCTNKINTVITETEAKTGGVCVSGFVVSCSGKMKYCINEGDMEYNIYYPDITDSNLDSNCIYVGGIACTNNHEGSIAGHFANCENRGNIKITKKSDAKTGVGRLSIGGICGAVKCGVYSKTETDGSYSSFNQCKNSGKITYWEDGNSKNFGGAIGGIVGACTKYSSYCPYVGANDEGYMMVLRTCTNTGDFDVSSSCTSGMTATATSMSGARQMYIGGLVGFAMGSAAVVDNKQSATNYPIIRGSSNCTMALGGAAGCECAGGIIGGGGFLSLEYLANSSLVIKNTENTMHDPAKIGVTCAIIGWQIKRALISGVGGYLPTMKIDASGATLPITFVGCSGVTGANTKNADGMKSNTNKQPITIYETSGTTYIKFAGKKQDSTTFEPETVTQGNHISPESFPYFWGTGNNFVRKAGNLLVVAFE